MRKNYPIYFIVALILFIGNIISMYYVFVRNIDGKHNRYYGESIISKYLIRDKLLCYKEKTENTMDTSQNDLFKPGTIFFHSLSCDRLVNIHDACVIESACRLNPKRNVALIFAGPITADTWHKAMDVLLKFENILIVYIHVESYASGTPFEKFWEGIIRKRKILSHDKVTEYVKFLTLYKFGGTIIDFNIILTKSLDSLGDNWIAYDEKESLGSDIMSISEHGHNFTENVLRELNKQMEFGSINAKEAMMEVLKRSRSSYKTEKAILIPGFRQIQIYEPDYFYPINKSNWKLYFRHGYYNRRAFGHRVWNTNQLDVAFPPYTIYTELAKKFCPTIYSMFYLNE